MRKNINLYVLMSFAVLGVMAGPVAVANMVFGYILGDAPCTSCWALRINMIVVAAGALFIIRYGLKMKYLALIIMVSAFGIWNAFWHLGWYAQMDIGQGQALPIFNIHTQIWAGIVFWAVLIVLGLILAFANLKTDQEVLAKLNYRNLTKVNKFAFVTFMVVTTSNAVQAFIAAGPPPFTAPDSPARFTFNPKYNSWSSLLPNAFSAPTWRGPFGVDTPDLPAQKANYMEFDHNVNNSPLHITTKLNLVSEKNINLDLNSPISGIRFNKKTNQFAIATQDWGMYLTNKDLNNIHTHLILDSFYFPFMTNFADIDIMDNENIKIMGTNKTYAIVKYDPVNADEVEGFAHFKEGADKFVAIEKNSFRTVRANTNYVNSFVSLGDYSYTISVPSNLQKNFVVIKQSNIDGVLSGEYTPTLASNIQTRNNKGLGDYYITGLAKKDGMLYALSKNYNTILQINPKTEKIVKTYSYPSKITNARAIDFVDGNINIVSYQDGKNKLYILK